jgi:hypothetical protein
VGPQGVPGERGPVGPQGKLPLVKEWTDKVHYEGDVVVHAGGLWQANCDTAREPRLSSSPKLADWICLAQAGTNGRDARPMRICGTYKQDTIYEHLDVVTKDSSSFVALKDDPGSCPGDGWQMLACGGKRGAPGEKGDSGERGQRGEMGMPGRDGVHLVSWKIDRKNYRVIAKMSDGTEKPFDLQELFEQFHSETR